MPQYPIPGLCLGWRVGLLRYEYIVTIYCTHERSTRTVQIRLGTYSEAVERKNGPISNRIPGSPVTFLGIAAGGLPDARIIAIITVEPLDGLVFRNCVVLE